MRLMMVEYTYTPAPPDKGPVVHGVCNRRRLEHIIEDGSIVAKMIEDDAAAKLMAKWEGDIEPAPKKKSPPDVQVPANPAPSTLTQAEIEALRKANAPIADQFPGTPSVHPSMGAAGKTPAEIGAAAKASIKAEEALKAQRLQDEIKAANPKKVEKVT